MLKRLIYFLITAWITAGCSDKKHAVVFQSDFGLKDGAVSAMKGVALSVDDHLQLFDLTHEIPAFNTWEAAYRLYQVAEFWPPGTVFVSVVDPGVGTSRRSIVMRSKTGHYFVTPDNGTLTLIAEHLGIDATREIDETKNRRTASGDSYTFHGRDVYAYTAARLASGTISFEEVGKLIKDSLVSIPYQKPVLEKDSIKGNIPVLDVQYGNVWTNIHDSLFKKLNIIYGDKVEVKILHKDSVIYKNTLPFAETFGKVEEGSALAYMNSLMNFSLAVNLGNFSETFHVKSGFEWKIIIRKSRL